MHNKKKCFHVGHLSSVLSNAGETRQVVSKTGHSLITIDFQNLTEMQNTAHTWDLDSGDLSEKCSKVIALIEHMEENFSFESVCSTFHGQWNTINLYVVGNIQIIARSNSCQCFTYR